MLGTILPVDDEVAQIVCAEFGARWTVASAGDPDKVVQVIGQRVTVAPGTIEVDAVTEDVVVPDPYVHLAVGTGSGAMYSHAGTYAAARSGTAVTLFPQSGFSTVYYVGQTFTSGPFYERLGIVPLVRHQRDPGRRDDPRGDVRGHVLPALGRSHAAARYMAGTSTWNSAPTPPAAGGRRWRPPTGVPGANLSASYPLRAKANTARALKDSFVTFEDAGTGLAGAIVKGGATQLVPRLEPDHRRAPRRPPSPCTRTRPSTAAPPRPLPAAVIPPEVPELVVLLALVVIAAMFAAIELTRTRGQDLVAWAILALALAVLWDRT